MSKAKKGFLGENPALNFITPPEDLASPAITGPARPIDRREEQQPEAPTRQTTGKAPAGYKLNPEYVELKSKRVQLLLQPSTVARVKAYAAATGSSMNETVNEAILEFLATHEKQEG